VDESSFRRWWFFQKERLGFSSKLGMRIIILQGMYMYLYKRDVCWAENQKQMAAVTCDERDTRYQTFRCCYGNKGLISSIS